MLQERLRQLGSDVPVVTAPPASESGGLHGHGLLWSWTADSIEALGRFAAACHELDLVLLVGIARWVPLDTVLGVLAAAGLTPREAVPVTVAGHRGVGIQLTRDEVATTHLALAMLELVTWSAPWHRGRQQPLRLAVAGAIPHDLRDLPHATDTRSVWLDSPAALRLASPELFLVGEQADQARDHVVEAVADLGTLPAGSVSIEDDAPLRRPTLAAEELLMALQGPRAGDRDERARDTGSARAVLRQLARGRPVDVPSPLRSQLAPEVLSAAACPEHDAGDPLRREHASTRLRWSVLRQHSMVGLAAALEARTGRAVMPRPRLSLYLDATAPAPAVTIDATIRQLAAQRRPPDEVVLLTAGRETAGEDLQQRLQRSLGIEVTVGTGGSTRGGTGDLVVVLPLDARLAADALADLELAHRLWSPTVSVIPVDLVLDTAGGLHRTRIRNREGLSLPATSGVVAFAGRELRAHWGAEALGRRERAELVQDAVDRGGMIHTMPGLRAVFDASPTTLAGAHRLDIAASALLAADHA